MANNKWKILWVTVSGASLTFFDNTVMPVALPTIQKYFSFSEMSIVWVVNAYLLSLTAFLLIAGRLIDLFGKKRLFLWGLLLFGIGSLVGALSFSITSLFIARILQGAGGAMIIPTTGAILTDRFPLGERAKAIGINTGLSSVALILGPIVGGVLTEYFTWRSVFFFNLPLIGLGVITAVSMLKQEEVKKEPFHFWGALPLILGIVSLVVSLMQANAWGWASFKTIGLLAVSPIFFTLFIWISMRTKHPLIEFALFKEKLFTAANLCIFLLQIVLMVTILWAIYFQEQLHFSPLKTGLLIFIAVGPVFLIAPFGGYLADRFGARFPLLSGFFLLAFALFWLLGTASRASVLAFLPGLLAFGSGIPLIMSPTVAMALSYAPKQRLGAAAGMTVLTRQLASTLGIALMTAIFYGTLQRTASHAKAFSTISLLAGILSIVGFIFVFFIVRGKGPQQLDGHEPCSR